MLLLDPDAHIGVVEAAEELDGGPPEPARVVLDDLACGCTLAETYADVEKLRNQIELAQD